MNETPVLSLANRPVDGYDIGLYDSADLKSLPVIAAAEIVGATEPTILLYTKAARGWIVQILHCYEGKKYGAASHFHIEGLSPRHWWVEKQAKFIGVSPDILMEYIDAGLQKANSLPEASDEG